MFPVPSHLPRSANEHGLCEQIHAAESDPVLELLASVFEGDSKKPLSVDIEKVRSVKRKLEFNISQNKDQSHQLLKANFPSVSSQIRLGHSLRGDFDRLQHTLASLERQVDALDTETSFLPPVLSHLDRHFTAVQSRSRARSHVSALKALRSFSDRIRKLETAIWSGRGADKWVVNELVEDKGYSVSEGEEMLQDVKVQVAAQQRLELFKSMVVEQVTDAFDKAVSFSDPHDGKHGISITVQARTLLQQPRIPRPQDIASPNNPSRPPPYSLAHIYSTLSSFSALTQTLSNLRTKLLRDLLPPLVSGTWKIVSSKAETLSILRLEHVEERRQPKELLDDVSTVLSFLKESIFPSPSTPLAERQVFIHDMEQAIFRAVLDSVILPAMPSSLSSIPAWLEIVHRAVDIEDAQSDEYTPERVIKPFFESEAGTAWASQRRRRIAEETRKLILGGWGGWEAKEAEREKEVVMVVEVEVEELEASDEAEKDEEFGWSFDDEAPNPTVVPNEPPHEPSMDVDEGWGFEEEQPASSGPSQSKPESPLRTNGKIQQPDDGDQDMGEGWDFEDVSAAPPAEPVKPVIAKPAREAKRLGKKVAKAKAVVDDDPWGPGSESMQSASRRDDDTNEHDGHDATAPSEAEGWGWDDPPPPVSQPTASASDITGQKQMQKRKELKEEKRTIRETFLVSRACDKLVDLAERVLREAKELGTSELPSPSFSSAIDVLMACATDVFDLHRSLLPSHYATQLRDVPTLAMQLHNDALHLASRVENLHLASPSWGGAEDLVKRLRALADHAFETQLNYQCDAIDEVIGEADGFIGVGSDIGFKKCERAINGIIHSLESISRVLKVVLPTTTYLSVVGYLLDQAVSLISDNILAMVDITEVESNRLDDLLKSVRPLEEIFVVESGQPSAVVAHVPHWLKFCYISELLQANLVDILYLFDSGALIDFTTLELVSLIRALFADSEKRDNAIEHIEKGTEVPDITA